MGKLKKSIESARAFLAAGTPQSALSALQKVPPAQTRNSTFWLLVAEAHALLGQPEQAAGFLQRALAIDPVHLESLLALGELLHYSPLQAESRSLFERALAVDPHCAKAMILSVEGAMLMAEQHGRDKLVSRLEEFITLDSELVYLIKAAYWVPFLDAEPELEKKIWSAIAHRFDSSKTEPLPVPAGAGKTRKIRIAYISPRFGDHPIGHVTKSLYGTHDREHFEVFLYSTSLKNHDTSEFNRYIRKSSDHYIELDGFDVEAATAMIRNDGIDVLVDLNGYMGQTYILEIFSRRAAPVQVYWLGHAGALGLPFYDYVIGDNTVTPREDDSHYTEAIARMPDTFHSTDRHAIAATPPDRTATGLDPDAFVFCVFNNPVKTDPAALAAWMEILKRVPGSQIWFSRGRNAFVEKNLKAFAAECGIDPGRIVFAGYTENKAEHLARHRLANLFLDTFTVNASTTALDALWAGLPIVAKPGRHFCSRNCTSFLRAVGLEELVCDSTGAYIEKAVHLATHPEELATLRGKLANNLETSPLFNIERFSRNLESAYRSMLDRRRAGEKPVSFDVTPVDLQGYSAE